MRELKSSGVEWIGKIPKDWTINRVKYLFDSGKGLSITKENLVDGGLPVISYGQIHSKTNNGVSIIPELLRFVDWKYSERFPQCYISQYDFVFADTSEDYDGCGNCAYKRDNSILFGGYHVVILHSKEKRDNRYLAYLFKTDEWRKQIRTVVSGVKVFSIPQKVIMNSSIILPSFEEQQKISDYLDAKCTEINALSADIQSEIETLEAYKRSVITEAVTKGLNPHVEMKDSGIEWIGEVPAHWMMLRGKYVFEQKSDRGNTKSLVLLSPTQNYGVIPQDMYEKLSGFSAVKLNEKTDLSQLKTVHRGAFVISLRSFQGGFEYSNFEGVVSPAYQVFYPTVSVHDGYYKYLFKTQIFIDKMNSYTMSLRDGKNIAFTDFGRTYIPVPPIEEQKEIVDCLNLKCSEIDTIIHQKKEQLDVLEQYKKSLIYEYVTGKKEVPAT